MKNIYPQWKHWPADRTAIIAEVGMNHGGDESLAWEMIRAAHESGADFVKLQSYVTASFFHPSLPYYHSTKSMELSFAAQDRLFRKAKAKQIALITTPYDSESYDFVAKFRPLCYKIASMDNDNYPLIRQVAKSNAPILVSTGMAGISEIKRLVSVIKKTGNNKFILLHCVSEYPPKPQNMRLAWLARLKKLFDCFVGLSDHSISLESSQIAISLGVSVVEKHFTIDRKLRNKFPNADHEISVEPDELRQLRNFSESVPKFMGELLTPLSKMPEKIIMASRRGIYAKRKILAGERLTLENTVFLRPVKGISVSKWDLIVGRKVNKDIDKLSPLRLRDLK